MNYFFSYVVWISFATLICIVVHTNCYEFTDPGGVYGLVDRTCSGIRTRDNWVSDCSQWRATLSIRPRRQALYITRDSTPGFPTPKTSEVYKPRVFFDPKPQSFRVSCFVFLCFLYIQSDIFFYPTLKDVYVVLCAWSHCRVYSQNTLPFRSCRCRYLLPECLGDGCSSVSHYYQLAVKLITENNKSKMVVIS